MRAGVASIAPPLPSKNENIVSIEENPKGVLVSNGKRWFLINESGVMPTEHQSSPIPTFRLDIPQASKILKKPQELISTIFKDAGGNLWVGYRNAGYQVISRNAVLYNLANQNLLSETRHPTSKLSSTSLT